MTKNIKYHSGYSQDAINVTIPNIISNIQSLMDGYDEIDEKLYGMEKLRSGLQKIYAGFMKLDKNISSR